MRGAGKPETRRPKAERRPKSEFRKGPTVRCPQYALSVRASASGFLSAFGLRVSGFRPSPTASLLLPFLLLALLTLPLIARGGDSSAAFEAANKLYEEGKFAEAAGAYEKLVQSGEVSEPLYFNLGNAWFKSGHIGRAIAAYRNAERLMPRDPDLRANLQFARNQTPTPTLAPSRWQRWLGRLTLNEWTVLAAGALWLWLLLLALLQWRPALRPSLRIYVYCLAAVVVLLCACVAMVLREAKFTRTAIVIAPEAAARFTPLPESGTAFTLHDGAELRVLDQKDEWFQINAGPRRTAWVRRDQVLVP